MSTARTLAQELADVAEHQIAREMPVTVVHMLEVVDVEHQAIAEEAPDQLARLIGASVEPLQVHVQRGGRRTRPLPHAVDSVGGGVLKPAGIPLSSRSRCAHIPSWTTRQRKSRGPE